MSIGMSIDFTTFLCLCLCSSFFLPQSQGHNIFDGEDVDPAVDVMLDVGAWNQTTTNSIKATSTNEDEYLICTVVEKHALPIALIEGTSDGEEVPDIPDELVGQCNDGRYYTLYSGSANDMETILDLHFDGIHPTPGTSQITLPKSAIVTPPPPTSRTKSSSMDKSESAYIDLAQIPNNDLQHRTINSRSYGDVTEGIYQVLVIRVITDDDEPSASKEQLADDVFGKDVLGPDVYNLRSGYRFCSGNKLNFRATSASGVSNGVYEVTLSQSSNGVSSGTVQSWAMDALPDRLKFSDTTNYFYFVLPGNVNFGSAAAWAYLPGSVSTYNDGYASVYLVMMHELGHNLGHHHSGLGDLQYADSSCWMGAHIYTDEGPAACFNGAKSWWFNWYSRASYAPTAEALTLKLVGNNDYLNGEATSQHVVNVQLKEGSDELYVYYNKKEGINSGVVAYGDTVTISEQPGARTISWHQAALGSGGVYEKTNWAGTGRSLFIEVCNMRNGSPDYAHVIVHVQGYNFMDCNGGGPTISPAPTPTPFVPGVLAMYWASESWWTTLPSGRLLDELGPAYKEEYVETIDYEDGYENFAGSGRSEDVAALFQGNLNFDIEGQYSLCLNSDDGSRMFFDGSKIIDNDGLHGMQFGCTTITTFGTHFIEVEYWERGGYSGLIFDWLKPGSSSWEVIPKEAWTAGCQPEDRKGKFWTGQMREKSDGSLKPQKRKCKWLEKATPFKIKKFCTQTEGYVYPWKTIPPAREVCTETCCDYL